jgi:hypothetical protein
VSNSFNAGKDLAIGYGIEGKRGIAGLLRCGWLRIERRPVARL